MSGAECYDSLKTTLADCWAEINDAIADGKIELEPGKTVSVETFLGGDYKVKK